MAGLNLSRSQAPAEVADVPEDLERDMKAWVKAWPSVEAAVASVKKSVQEFEARNREFNHKVGRKLQEKDLPREQKKALQDLLARTVATQDALGRLL